MNENTANSELDGIDTEKLLEKVAEAAREGAREGSKENRGGRGGAGLFDMVRTLILLLVIAAVGWMIYRFQNFTGDLKQLVERDAPVEERDLTLENHGILGYTAADFQEAILGDSEQLRKMEVYETEVSDTVELVDTGLANLKVFTKTQLLTYKGTATYTVDLGKLSKDDITLDEEKKEVHLVIPHAVLEPININEDEIEFGDVNRGLLGIGKMEMKPEDVAKVQNAARSKMEEKLEQQKVIEEADRFAMLSVWEIYQPMINAVTTGYSLQIEME